MSEVLVPFLLEMRRRKLRVGVTELVALAQALALGVHDSTLEGFYYVARSLCAHTESDLDLFDEAFAAHFRGIDKDARIVLGELEAWLDDPAALVFLSERERALVASLDLDELRRLFEERLREQTERHDGGSHWIGTGGTSPFGAGGRHPTGLRVGPRAGGRSALGVADARVFRPYRSDLVLDVRQIEVALRKLRTFVREGADEELDVDASIDATARNAGELEVVTRPPRRPNVRVILVMDVGGSMDPHIRVVSELFSAAKRATHFRELRCYYFHNAVYGELFESEGLRDPVSIGQILRECDGRRYHLVIVGDAAMHPGELHGVGPWYRALPPEMSEDDADESGTHPRHPGRRRRNALGWFRLLAERFPRAVWLNPDKPQYWYGTVQELAAVFRMYPLTLDGLSDAVAELTRGAAGARRGAARAGGA
jgi:uncharacterized protein with von Willebrand factor type A (vWA) domain